MTRKNFTTEKSLAANETLEKGAMNQLKGGKGTPVSTSTSIAKPLPV